jgi:hypothetical protein
MFQPGFGMNGGGGQNQGGDAQGGNQVDAGPWVWYMETPIVSRIYLTAAVLTTAACALDVVSPFSLYFNLSLITQGQVWRLFTNFVYFGSFNLDFLFHMYFLVSRMGNFPEEAMRLQWAGR